MPGSHQGASRGFPLISFLRCYFVPELKMGQVLAREGPHRRPADAVLGLGLEHGAQVPTLCVWN